MASLKSGVPEAQQALLKKIKGALRPFRTLRETMPLQYVNTFLLVAADEGLNVSEYAKRAGVSQSLMTRHLHDLGQVNRYHEEGLGLVEVRDDPMDRRNRNMYLTVKGKHVAWEVCEAFEGSKHGIR